VELAQSGKTITGAVINNTASVSYLRKYALGAKLDEGLFRVMQSVEGREALREALLLSCFSTEAAAQLREQSVINREAFDYSRLLEEIATLIQKVDTPTRQVLLEAKILEITLGDGFDSFFNLSLTPGGKVNPSSDAAINSVVRNEKGLVGLDLVNAASLAENSLQFLFIADTIQARMELLEKTGRLRRIATPLMLCANNAAAKLFQGVESPIRKGYTVSEEKRDSENNIVSPASIKTDYDEQEVGISLEVSPLINEDRTIALKIKSAISTVQLGGGPEFNYNVGGVSQVGETDTVSKTEIEGIIIAMDGQTLALGGLVQEEDVDNLHKVPVLGDIPLLGLLFRSQGTSKEQKEIIFCITPHIMMSPAENGRINERVMKRISEHPYYRNDQEGLLRYQAEEDAMEVPPAAENLRRNQ